ncbi:hypothetical protein Moror_16996 [Moniliophthora roreri MCA 2997]|uniref:Uncharacterized protein n=2 Tax=Moniliophthora roreri TaxID=221103 RepID=V2WUG7_MONRO|nr:hypothetical protein Moror_16996 [Moniliophthora roreri MCA 2997]
MFSHLQTIIASLPPSVAMATTLDFWSNTRWDDVSQTDVQAALVDDTAYFHAKCVGPNVYCYGMPDAPDMVLHSKPFVRLLYHQQYWLSLAKDLNATSVDELLHSIEEFKSLRGPGIRFYVPFPVAERVWTHSEDSVRSKSTLLMQVYEDSWRRYPGPEEEWDQRLAFIVALARHINSAGSESEIVTSVRGRNLLKLIHDQIIEFGLYKPRTLNGLTWDKNALVAEWVRALKRVRECAGLPLSWAAEVPVEGLREDEVQVQLLSE